MQRITAFSFLFALTVFIATELYLIHEGVVKVFFIFLIPVFVSSSVISLAPLLLFLIPLFVSLKRPEFTTYQQYINNTYQNTGNIKKKNTSYGGFLMIGPVPIMFGKGLSSRTIIALVIFSILVIAISIVFFLL